MTLTTTQRGLGAEHQALRRTKLAALVPGSPCRRCGHPRYHPGRCPHGPCWLCRLDLGHFTDRVFGGQGPRELEHSYCNRAAGTRLLNKLMAGRRRPAPRRRQPRQQQRRVW